MSEFVGGLGGGAFVTGNATLRRSRIESNKAARGAGFLAQGKLTLSDSAVLGNTAHARTSTVWLVQTDGGGLVADELDANRVTFTNNYADTCVSIAQSVSSFGSAVSARTATLVNVSIVGKSFGDDTASTSSPVVVNAALQFEVSPVTGYTPLSHGRSRVSVAARVKNLGPHNALSGGENPIVLAFEPAPGVPASPQRAGVPTYSVPKDHTHSVTLEFILDGLPTSPLGTLELLPGLNQVSGPTKLPVVYEPPPLPAD